MKNRKMFILWFAAAMFVLNQNSDVFAKNFLYHATKKTIAGKIAAKGFSSKKMNPNSRFGKGVYVSDKPGTALKESRHGETLVRGQSSKQFQKKVLDMRKPTPERIKGIFGAQDLRGKVRNGIIGPMLGRKLGSSAGKKGQVIRYNSIKDPESTNYFIPRRVLDKNPGIIRQIRIKEGNRYR